MQRGRPPLRRAAVERYIVAHVAEGKLPPIGQIMRACGVSDRSDTKRILRDLRRLGRIPEFPPVLRA